MAGTLFKALTAIGLKTTAALQSLFLFPFTTFLRVVDLFPNLRQPTQPTLPCSTSGSASSASSSRDSHNDAVADGGRSNNRSDMAPASSSSAAQQSQNQKPPTPKIVPALPRAPLTEKGNRAPVKAAPPPEVDAQLSDKVSRLNLKEDATTVGSSSTSVQDVVNAAGSVAENETGKPVSLDSANGSAAEEVTRELKVPQTSELKETATTIELDGETVEILSKVETSEQAAERAMHSRFMREALDMARLALKTNETPVGCVLVYKGRVIARGMNATNVTRNGTRHAELMAISALLSYSPASDIEPAKTAARLPLGDKTNEAQGADETSTWGDVDPKDGHLYPYGQKLHPSPRVDASVITECTLYVTVEPCVMCASLLRQLGIKKVYFGAVNDKFGGTGGVFRIHKNSPHSMASAPPSPAPQGGKGIVRPVLERRAASTTDIVAEEQNPMEEVYTDAEHNVVVSPIETSSLPGDGGNIERGYEAEGGWGRDEAVTLLRQFYVQENNRAPVPRKKEGRAARLAAMMERDGHAGGPMSDASADQKPQEDSGTTTPATQEPAVEDTAVATKA